MRRKIDVADPGTGRVGEYEPGAAQLVDEVGNLISTGVSLVVFDLLMLPDMVEGMHWVLSEVMAEFRTAGSERASGNRPPRSAN
jgi:hypothetical protein